MTSTEVKYKPTTTLYKIAEMTKPIRIVQGAQSASKTISILMLLINAAQHNPRYTITIAQYELSKAKKTVIRDFINIMVSYGFFVRAEWNKSDSIYTFENGSYIEFIGLDMADVGKGFRRDIVYINELNRGKITLDTFVQLQTRCSIIYVDFNPDNAFFIHTEVLTYSNAEMITVTYKDNEYCPENEKKSIEGYALKGYYNPTGDIDDINNIKNTYWANKHRVYALGLTGIVEGTIITNWQIIDEIPKEAKYLGAGLDFGFNDPNAAVKGWMYNQDILLDEILFGTSMSNNEIAQALLEAEVGTVYCDSAEPKSIRELRRLGVRALPAKKEAGSVIAGIKIMQQRTIYVTRRSKNLIKAFTYYKFIQNSDSTWSNKPHHNYSDIVDAARYLCYMKVRAERDVELDENGKPVGEKRYAIL